MPTKSVVQAIHDAFMARRRAESIDDLGHYEHVMNLHGQVIDEVMKRTAPRGGGIDSGTEFDEEKSRPGRLVFTTAFHHMNADGYYTGWTYHDVLVTPTFGPPYVYVRVNGKDQNGIKDYLCDVFTTWLSSQAPADEVLYAGFLPPKPVGSPA